MRTLNLLTLAVFGSFSGVACTDNSVHEVGDLDSTAGSGGTRTTASSGGTTTTAGSGGQTTGAGGTTTTAGSGGQTTGAGGTTTTAGSGGQTTGAGGTTTTAGSGGQTTGAGGTPTTIEPPPGHNPTVWPVAAVDGRCDPAPRAEVKSIAVAPSGDIYLAGTYSGTPDFGTGPLPNLPDIRLFLAKFDAQGNPAWAQAYAGFQADVKVDHAGRPVFAATTIMETRSGGSGTLRQLDPSNGAVRWEYPYSWPAGYYASQIALEAGTNTTLAIPGNLISLDANGQVVWNAAIAQSGQGDPGSAVEVVESSSGSLTAFMIDYVTWSPSIYQYRLFSFDATGKQRWTRRLEANINQLLHMAGDATGRAAIFGTGYGSIGIEGSSPLSMSEVGIYLGITDPSGNVLVQQVLDRSPASATWQNGRLIAANIAAIANPSGSRTMQPYAFGFFAVDTAGVVASLPEPGLPTMINPTVLMATQGNKILVTGARENVWCMDCTDCFQTRPYLMRLDASGVRDASFGEFMP